MSAVIEQAVVLGRYKSLVGIVTKAAPAPENKLPAVVILNTGIIHRVGHHRMYVSLSRALAMAGHTVLRFDFSGVGDSTRSAEGLPLLESCLAEIGEAVDWLESTRNDSLRVILVGLCSGADHALLYGHSDPRIVGLILMDPSVPPTPRYLMHYIRPRVFRMSSWLSVLRGRGRIWHVLGETVAHAIRSEWIRPKWDPQYVSLENSKVRTQLEWVYQASLDRGMKFLTIFAGPGYFRQTYREQLLDAFPSVTFGKYLRLEYFENSDHTFSLESDRRKLIQVIQEWLGGAEFNDAAKTTGLSFGKNAWSDERL
jgi:pimeloyl-ACP methyl ester carboxylesterase